MSYTRNKTEEKTARKKGYLCEYMPMSFYFTKHALIEIDNDNLNIDDVKRIALDGEILKVYPDDRKGTS